VWVRGFFFLARNYYEWLEAELEAQGVLPDDIPLERTKWVSLDDQITDIRESFHECCYLLSGGKAGEYKEARRMEVFSFFRFVQTAKKYNSRSNGKGRTDHRE
jgi:hypothetical protein